MQTIEVNGHTVHLQQAVDLYVDVLEGRAVLVHPDAERLNDHWVTGREDGAVVKRSVPSREVGQHARVAFERWGRGSR